MPETRSISLNTINVIDGNEIVIVLDIVTSNESEKGLFVKPANEDHKRIIVDENEIKKARAEFKGVDTHGIWDLLITNNMITDDHLQVMHLDDGKGIYCVIESNSIVETGYFTGKTIPGRPDLSIDNCRVIPNSTDIFIDLSKPILLLIERSNALKDHANKLKKRRIYMFLAIASLGVVASYVEPIIFSSESDNVASEANMLSTLKNKFNLLKSSRSGNIEKSKGLSNIIWLSTHDQFISTDGKISLSSGQYKLVFSSSYLVPDEIKANALADGRAEFDWSANEH